MPALDHAIRDTLETIPGQTNRADGREQQLVGSSDNPWTLLARNRRRSYNLNDWLRDPVKPPHARDLVEVIDDRCNRRSTLIATQAPVEEWHPRLGDSDLADAILDRRAHNAYRFHLTGDSERKARFPLSNTSTSDTR